MKQAIHNISDSNNLPITFLNDDFKYTDSFTQKIYQYSTFYKTFSNVVEVRTIKAEYLVAMKLTASRKIRHDRSDIIGILNSERNLGNNITIDKIKQAVIDLYGTWDKVDDDSKFFILQTLENDNLEKTYQSQFIRENSLREDVKNVFNSTKLSRTRENLHKLIDQLDKRK